MKRACGQWGWADHNRSCVARIILRVVKNCDSLHPPRPLGEGRGDGMKSAACGRARHSRAFPKRAVWRGCRPRALGKHRI